MKTVKEICDFFWFLEKKYGLLDFEIQKVKPWQYMRMSLYYQIAQQKGIIEPNSPKFRIKSNLRRKNTIKNAVKISKNPFFCGRKDILIFSHPRLHRTEEGKRIDIYTYYYVQELLNRGASFCEIERKHSLRSKKDEPYLFSMDFITLLAGILEKFYLIKLKLTDTDNDFLKIIRNDIKKKTNLPLNIHKITSKSISLFRAYHVIYRILLKTIRPKKIFVVVSYSNLISPLIKSAKELDIPVYEFQHGIFSEFHLGYSYPGRKKPLDYFPDYFLVWSKYWKKIAPLPLKKENVIVHNFRHLENYKKKAGNVRKKKGQAVVLSQTALGGPLAEAILQNWDFFKKYSIKYKLHPEEYNHWKSHSALVRLVTDKKVELLSHCDLYKLLLESEYQIGVFSTALFEGVEFGCKTILINLPGIEYMDKFIEIHSENVTIID